MNDKFAEKSKGTGKKARSKNHHMEIDQQRVTSIRKAINEGKSIINGSGETKNSSFDLGQIFNDTANVLIRKRVRELLKDIEDISFNSTEYAFANCSDAAKDYMEKVLKIFRTNVLEQMTDRSELLIHCNLLQMKSLHLTHSLLGAYQDLYENERINLDTILKDIETYERSLSDVNAIWFKSIELMKIDFTEYYPQMSILGHMYSAMEHNIELIKKEWEYTNL
jgi:hypothetical protein